MNYDEGKTTFTSEKSHWVVGVEEVLMHLIVSIHVTRKVSCGVLLVLMHFEGTTKTFSSTKIRYVS